MTDWIVGVALLVGAAFVLVSGIGLLRMPDLFLRMHAATKAGTLGVGLILGAVAIDAGESGEAVRAVAAIVFIFLTAPVAAHAIGRAAYFRKDITLWKGTVIDQLRGRYDEVTHSLRGEEQAGFRTSGASGTGDDGRRGGT